MLKHLSFPVALSVIVALTLLAGCASHSSLRPRASTDVIFTINPNQPAHADFNEPVTYDVEFSAVVTPPYHCKLLRVWMPVPQSGDAQDVSHSRFTTYPMRVEATIRTEPMYGNGFAYFEFDHPEGAQIIKHSFRVRTWQARWHVDLAKVQTVADWPASFDAYRREVTPLVNTPEFKAVVAQVTGDTSPATGLFNAMDWIDRTMTYDHVNASLQASADWAFEKHRGHCSDYHGLCQTMGRQLGTPTRVAYGINLFPKNSPTHCKLEAFLPPYGWVSFDLSETQNQISRIQKDTTLTDEQKTQLIAAARRRLKTGFRDNTWMAWTRGTNYELAPKASSPVAVVRTIYAEADGKALPEPDPANSEQHEFSWMTVHKYVASRKVAYPFKDNASLQEYVSDSRH